MTTKEYQKLYKAALLIAVKDGDVEPIKKFLPEDKLPYIEDKALLTAVHKLCVQNREPQLPDSFKAISKKWLAKNGYGEA